MRNRKNFTPFLILIILHSSLLGFTFLKKNDRKRLLILLLTGTGLTYFFEYIVLVWLKAYRYKPKMMKNNDLDNFFGAILSQAVFVPFTAIFLTAFKFGWKAKLLFGLYFAGIEKIFLRLRIYHNKWWRTTYTVILIPLFFFFNDRLYARLKSTTPLFRLFSLTISISVIGLNILYVMSVLRKFRFGLGRWHKWEEHFKVAPFYSISLSLGTALMVRKSQGWKTVLKAFTFAKIMDFIVIKTGVAKKNFKHFLINNSIHIMMILISMRFVKWIYFDFSKADKNPPTSEEST